MIDGADRRALATVGTWLALAVVCVVIAAAAVAVSLRLFLWMSGV